MSLCCSCQIAERVPLSLCGIRIERYCRACCDTVVVMGLFSGGLLLSLLMFLAYVLWKT